VSDFADQPRRSEQTSKRKLQPARGRRQSSRQAPYSTAAPDRGRCSISSSGGGRRGFDGGGQSDTLLKEAKPKKPHFNLRYPKSVKLFILYHKEDCGWSWEDINRRRLDLLPVLYPGGFKPEIEENRAISGINGFYYRLNEIMPALTSDGTGLCFVEKGGRSWELTVPCKCREGPARGGREKRKGGGRATKAKAKAKGDGEAVRPRGMVDRYPEDVVHYWDEFVKHFVPQVRHAEVYARAKRLCKYCPHTVCPPHPFIVACKPGYPEQESIY
jgi:hypothetical protein